MRTINNKMKRFARYMVTADSRAQAARLAGYPANRARITGHRLFHHPGVQVAIQEERERLQKEWGIERDALVSMLLEDHRKAVTATEEVAAIRELGKLLGLYAPQQKQVDSVGFHKLEQLEQMSDSEFVVNGWIGC